MNRLLVFSGYNQRGVIALLRTATQLKVPYCIVASGKSDTILTTDYQQYVVLVRENLETDITFFEPLFQHLSNAFPTDDFVVAPSTESLNRLFLKHRKLLSGYRITVPLVDEELYLQFSEKILFSELCTKHGILVPHEYDTISVCPSKFVAKPKFYYSKETNRSLSPVLIETAADREAFLKSYNHDEFYYQQYVDGTSYYLLYYVCSNGQLYKFSQKNITQQADGKSILLAHAGNFHEERISDAFETLFRKLGYRGLIMIELRRDNADDYMIEANPRIWGPSQLCVDAHANLLHVFLNDWGLTETSPDFSKINYHTKYCWWGGFKEDLTYGKKIHPLSPQSFAIEEFISYLGSDVYLRNDTMQIYKMEK